MMKKTIRLTESDLNRLVTKVINEGKKYEFIDEHPNYKEFKTKIKELKIILAFKLHQRSFAIMKIRTFSFILH